MMVSEASYHSWSTVDLCGYVKANLPESEAVDIIEKLKYHSIRGAHLDEIKPDDLLYMGITKWGHRRSLLGLIEKIRRSSQSTPPKETASSSTTTPTGSPPADIIVYPLNNKFVPLSMQFGLTSGPQSAPASGANWSSSSSRTTSPSSTPEGEAIEGEPGYASKSNHPLRPTPTPATGHSVPIASRQSIAPIIANRAAMANAANGRFGNGYPSNGFSDVDHEGAAPGSPVDLSMLDEDDIMAHGVANLNINSSLSSSVPIPAGPSALSSSPSTSMFSTMASINGPRLYSKLCSIKDCNGENCDRAHSLAELYCRFCDTTGHSGDKHRDDTRCMHCNSPDHSVLHCKRNTDLCYMTGARHNEKYCAYVHSPDNARCAYCLASNHILAMCASETIRCIRCRNTGHHDSNPLKCPMHPEYPYYAAILAKMGRDIRDIKPKIYKNVQDILFYDWRDAGVSLIEFADGIARYKLAKKGKQAINAPKHEQIAMNIHANMSNNNSPINPISSLNSLNTHGSLSLGGSPTSLSPIIVKHQPQFHSGNLFDKRHDFVSTHDF